MSIKTRLTVYLVVVWGLTTAKTKDERQEILKMLSDFERRTGG